MEPSDHSSFRECQSTEIHDLCLLENPATPKLDPLSISKSIPADLTPSMESNTNGTEENQLFVRASHDNSEKKPNENNHGSSDADIRTDHQVADLGDQVISQPRSLINYRPTTMVPTFEELHQQGAVTLTDPSPSHLRLARSFGIRGPRISYRDYLDIPGQVVLPSEQEPLSKQILDYCQRWGFWIAHVKDDKRRAELLQWVEQMTQKHWQNAINNGYCGEPNGHKHCCLAHEFDGSAAKDGKRAVPQGDTRKRMSNTGKQPAPFACEGGKHSYSIVNRELENYGVTMETVLSRMSPEDLKSGNELLKEMCSRVERDSLIESDWKPAMGRLSYNPGVHGRNLLMYCLWEVQRCRSVIDQANLNLSKASTTYQAKNAQKRIDTYQLRASQHLALAVILDEKREKGDSDVSGTDDPDTAINDGRRKSKRLTKPTAVIDVASDQDNEESVAEGSQGEATGPASVCGDGDEIQHNSMETEEQAQPNEHEVFHETPTNKDIAPSTALEKISLEEQNTYQIGKKRELAETDRDSQPGGKRVKFDREQSTTNDPEHPNFDTALSVQDKSPASRMDNAGSITWPVAGTLFPAQTMTTGNTSMLQSQQHPTKLRLSLPRDKSSAQSMTKRDTGVKDSRQLKGDYTYQFWQPRIEAILQQRGFRPLGIRLRGWPDVKVWLQELEFDLRERNELLREYKSGFEQWQQQIRVSDSPAVGPASDSQLESTRGFHFRYFTTTTEQERAQVDDMVGDYVQAIMSSRSARFGYYAVFIVNGTPNGKELAHGFWDLQKERKAEDADWFYQNQARPDGFRTGSEVLWHPWGYSIPPASKRSQTKPASKISKYQDDFDNDGDNDTTPTHTRAGSRRSGKANHHSRASRSSGTSRARTTASNRKRYGIGDDSDGDDDWRPDY